MNKKWDIDYLALAKWWAERKSKDPSTKVGAVIVRSDKTVVSLGYNGFPRGIEDTEERLSNRALKYPRMVHAEMNAVLNAKEPLDGYTLYVWPPAFYAPTCDRCAVHIIQAGIKRVVGYRATEGDETAFRWEGECMRAFYIYEEAGVEVVLYDI